MELLYFVPIILTGTYLPGQSEAALPGHLFEEKTVWRKWATGPVENPNFIEIAPTIIPRSYLLRQEFHPFFVQQPFFLVQVFQGFCVRTGD